MRKFLEVFIAAILVILALPAILLVSICAGVFVAVDDIVQWFEDAL